MSEAVLPLVAEADTTPPTVTITDNVAATVNRATGPVTFTLSFSEPVTGLDVSDFTVQNGTPTAVTGSGANWGLSVTPTNGVTSGTLSVSLKAGAVTDGAGNANAAFTYAQQAIDTRAPFAPKIVTTQGFDSVVDPRVTLQTNLGTIVVELDPGRAPVTVANFLALTHLGYYDGTVFHRVIPGFVAQGGGFVVSSSQTYPTLSNLGDPYTAITLESGNGLRNLRGQLAMARTSAPDSATSEFFSNLVDNDFLDYEGPTDPGYAVFGKVVSGLDVIDAIAALRSISSGGFANLPATKVEVLSARQTTAGEAFSASGRFQVAGVETGATWYYSLDTGTTWSQGSGDAFTVPAGQYAAGQIRVRQIDAAGNPDGFQNTFLSDLQGRTVLGATLSSALTVGASESTVPGTDAPETLAGDARSDRITGLGGNDTITGGVGFDSVDGGDGSDTVVFTGALANYTVGRSGGTTVVADGVASRDDIDVCTNVERLKFSDVSLNLTIQATAASIDLAKLDRICELYVGFFSRVPAADGLENWVNQFKGGKSINTIADDFYGIGSSEALRSITGYWDFTNNRALTDQDFVRIVYRNVLGREGLQAGIDYWAGQLSGTGAKTRGELVSTMLDAAHGLKTSADWGWVANLLDDRITMSKRVAIEWGLNYGATAQQAIEKGKAIADAVDESANPNPAYSAIPVKTFDFSGAADIVGVNPAYVDLLA